MLEGRDNDEENVILTPFPVERRFPNGTKLIALIAKQVSVWEWTDNGGSMVGEKRQHRKVAPDGESTRAAEAGKLEPVAAVGDPWTGAWLSRPREERDGCKLNRSIREQSTD